MEFIEKIHLLHNMESHTLLNLLKMDRMLPKFFHSCASANCLHRLSSKNMKLAPLAVS